MIKKTPAGLWQECCKRRNEYSTQMPSFFHLFNLWIQLKARYLDKLINQFHITLNGEIAWLRVSTEALFLLTVSVILFDAASRVVAASLHSVRFFSTLEFRFTRSLQIDEAEVVTSTIFSASDFTILELFLCRQAQ